MKVKIALILIVILAFVLRFYRVSEIPPSLNWDEVAIGYNAYSILNTGKDEWGQSFPLSFKSYGEYKLPIQIYSSIPGIAVFGLNELGVRITPVIYGTLTVLIIFFLANVIFKSKLVGLISALFLAISPWHIQLTRASFESSTSVFWVSLGILFLIKGFTNKKWLIWSVIPLAISMYTYNSARVFTPLFLVVILLLFRNFFLENKKYLLISIILLAIFLLPLASMLRSGEAAARFKLVSITDDPGFIPRINEHRVNSTLPMPLPIIIHNKFTYFSGAFISNYLAHFTPNFLFLTGGGHKQHHVQNMGELYIYQALFIFVGIVGLFKNKIRFRLLLLAWLLLGVVPVSITVDNIPSALRTLLVIIPYQLISAYGVLIVMKYLQQKAKRVYIPATSSLVFVVIICLIGYLYNYYYVYPYLYSRDWQYGYKQVVSYIRDNQSKYDQIYMTDKYGQPYMFSLFYLQYDPSKYQTENKVVDFNSDIFVKVTKFDKYNFVDFNKDGYAKISKEIKGKRILLIGKKGDFPEEKDFLKKVNFLNGVPAFEIMELL